jgi:hypothetical protein
LKADLKDASLQLQFAIAQGGMGQSFCRMTPA